MRQVQPEFSEENLGAMRYVDHQELRYSLRFVEAYAPWVNHIYVITDEQKPSWMKSHPKITIIDHSEIVPSIYRPLFSSIAIEMFLATIPSLSEHFLYCNDDMFFNRDVKKSDFFDEAGRPIVWLSPAQQMSLSLALKLLSPGQEWTWHTTLIRAWFYFCNKNSSSIPFYTSAHSVDAYTRSMYLAVLKKYPDLIKLNVSPFRTGGEISRLLFSYEMIREFDCKFKLRGREV